MKKKATKIKMQTLASENYSKAIEIPVKISFKEPNFLFPLMRKSLVKFTAILLITALNWAGLSAVIETIASFNDTEGSPQNIFAATTLDFSLNSPPDFSPVIMPDATSSRDISLTNDGILGFDYKVQATNTVGILCNHLNLEAKLNGTTTYNGHLTDFDYNVGGFGTETRDWQFIATLNSDNPILQNQTCVFDFVFDGDQIEGAGFNDHEIIQNTITSGIWQKVVINKVYYDPDPEHSGEGTEKKYEWIELYNPTDQDIDLKDWGICNKTDCATINDHVIISALGYALIVHDASIWQYWEIIDGAVFTYTLSGNFEMDDTADTLILKDTGSYNIDQMNWGAVPSPTSTWPNWNANLWDPGVPDAPEGHMLARVPTGVDTDTVSDWQDLGLPQVHVIWPNGGQVLWVGRTETLQWNATNTNGNADDLAFDIWYSANSGGTWANILKNQKVGPKENKGVYKEEGIFKYDWRISLCLDNGHGGCYYTPSHNARIKVAAFGPENFMVQNWDMSDEDFCPPIDYALLTLEEIEILREMGLMEEEAVGPAEEQPVAISDEEVATTTEEITTSTEETATPTEETLVPVENDLASNGSDSTSNGNQENGGIIETVNEVIDVVDETIDAVDETIDAVVEGIIEEIMSDEPAGETVEVPADDMIVEDTIIEPAPIEETLIIEQAPATEEQAVIAPEADSAEPPAGE